MALSILRSTLPRAGIPLTALRRRLHASAPRTTDDKPGIPPNDILDEYKEHRVEKATPSASINPEHQFQLPKEWADGDVGHDVLYDVGKHSKRTLSSFSMEGKVCVVTGAGRGLGNMMARTLVESGATQIVIVDLKQEESDLAAKELAEWFVQNGQAERGEIDAVGIQCDVASEASVKAAFAHIKDRFGRVDALVTAAGIVENFTAHEYPTDKVRKLLDINVMGTWFCALEGAKLMPEGGSIVMIGSMSGSIVNIPQPQTPYNFSKAAVRHMARSLAVEWAQQGIRVNCISPGYMLTNLTKVILDNNPVLRDAWIDKIPMGRMGDPSDLKGAVVYFASDASLYTTGAELTVDGGYTCV